MQTKLNKKQNNLLFTPSTYAGTIAHNNITNTSKLFKHINATTFTILKIYVTQSTQERTSNYRKLIKRTIVNCNQQPSEQKVLKWKNELYQWTELRVDKKNGFICLVMFTLGVMVFKMSKRGHFL